MGLADIIQIGQPFDGKIVLINVWIKFFPPKRMLLLLLGEPNARKGIIPIGREKPASLVTKFHRRPTAVPEPAQ
jgi:hypothetical protein